MIATLRNLSRAFVAALAPMVPAIASAPDGEVRVVATIPDLADLAQVIGGDRVQTVALARAAQNLHAVRVKPSHLVAVKRADLFLQIGLSLEHAWVPGLLETARNRSVLPGNPGFVSTGEGFPMIEVPERLDRSLSADVHPQGNPHINVSLDGGPAMAKHVLDGLVRIDPDHADAYRANHARWLEEYAVARTRWQHIADAVKERKASVSLFHQEFDYLLRDLGIEIACFLEPRPGLPPTPRHLAHVIETMRAKDVGVLLTASWSNNKSVARVAEATGAKVFELPVMVGGAEEHGSWIEMIDDSVVRLAAALGVDVERAIERGEARAAERRAAGDSGGKDGARASERGGGAS